jgi:polar amino acid transport system ATP-binding protein
MTGTDPAGTDPAGTDPPVLRVRGLRKAFDAHVVLDRLDLDASEHTCTALIGASGSGKSTLLRCIDLLESVDDGVVELDGQDITDPRVNANQVRTRIGIVFQAFNLFPHLSVLANITLAPRRVHGQDREQAEQQALNLLERVGLREKAAARPDQLSGGQQQRVAIARALANSPRLMLFDEITSALDPELVGEVLALVRELKQDGTTMLLATHEMSFARDVADQVIFLDGGRICEQGPAQQVLGDPQNPRTRQFLGRVMDAGRPVTRTP